MNSTTDIWNKVKFSNPKWISWIILQIFIMLSNTITIRIMYLVKSLPQLIIRLILSLAVADFTLGLGGLVRSIYIISFQNDIISSYFCNFDVFLIHVSLMSSIMNMTAITVFKLMSIHSPFLYERIESRGNLIICLIWLIILLICLEVLIDKNSVIFERNVFLCEYVFKINVPTTIKVIFIFVIPPILMFTLDVMLLLTARRQINKIHNIILTTSPCQKKFLKQHLKTVKTVFLMHIGFFIAWIPFSTTNILPKVFIGHSIEFLKFYVYYLSWSNSFWNPILYLFTVHEFRYRIKSIFVKNKVAVNPSVSLIPP